MRAAFISVVNDKDINSKEPRATTLYIKIKTLMSESVTESQFRQQVAPRVDFEWGHVSSEWRNVFNTPNKHLLSLFQSDAC